MGPSERRRQPLHRRLAQHRPRQLSVKTLHEFKRFALAGSINTIIGASLVYALQALTSNPYVANSLGYLISGFWAYFLHAKFTFKAKTSKRSFSLFAMISASGYGLNLLVLYEALRVVKPFYAQTAAIISYAAYSYVMQSTLAFPAHRRTLGSDEQSGRSDSL